MTEGWSFSTRSAIPVDCLTLRSMYVDKSSHIILGEGMRNLRGAVTQREQPEEVSPPAQGERDMTISLSHKLCQGHDGHAIRFVQKT